MAEERGFVRTAADRFQAKVAQRRWGTAPCFRGARQQRERGDGEARIAAEAREVRFYLVRNDTTRLSDGCTDVLLTRRGGGLGG